MAKGDTIRVLLADDHPVFRAGLRATLEDEPGITVVGEATNGDEIARCCARLAPNVLLLDLRMPGRPAEETIMALHAEWPTTRIVVVTASDDAFRLRQLVLRGAVGYVLKDESPTVIVAAVQAAMHGAVWFSRELTNRLLLGETMQLNEREHTLLHLLASGWKTNEIASHLHIGDQTARNYLSQLYGKLGVPNRNRAVTWAREHGVL